jgi:hypothetical protein
MINVLTLCNFCILANVLNFNTYRFANNTDNPTPRDRDQYEQWDRNGLSPVDREHMIYVRGLAINFIRWLSCNFEARSVESTEIIRPFLENLCGKYLLRQACAILNYKKLAEAERLPTIPHCKFRDVQRQLRYVLHKDDDDDEEAWYGDWTVASLGYLRHTSMSFGEHVTISRKECAEEFTGRCI